MPTNTAAVPTGSRITSSATSETKKVSPRTYKLDVDIPGVQRVRFNEHASGFHFITHQRGEDLVAPIASSICTLSMRRTAGSIVVSHSCSGSFRPGPCSAGG